MKTLRDKFIELLNKGDFVFNNHADVNIYKYGKNKYIIETQLTEYMIYDFKDEFYINEDLELNKPYNSSIFIDEYEEILIPFLNKVKLEIKLKEKLQYKQIKKEKINKI